MTTLGEPLRRFEAEVALLHQLYATNTVPSSSAPFWHFPDLWSVQCYVLIRLLDEWGLFCRRLILTSARGNVVATGGRTVGRSPALGRGVDVLDLLRRTYKKKRSAPWEPRWYDTGEAIDAAKRLRIKNLPEVAAGLGLSGTAPEDLRLCRNYVAHRSVRAELGVSGLRIRLVVPPGAKADALPSILMADGRLLIEHWCDDLKVRARAAVI